MYGEVKGTVERPKSVRRPAKKPGVEIARQAFIYQGVTDTAELAQAGGISKNTVWNHIETWKEEREQMLAKQSGLGVAIELSVDPKNYDINTKDVEFIRKRMDELQIEVESHGPIIDKLEQLLESVNEFQDKPDIALGLFDKYLRLCMNKKSLIKHFLDLKTVWNKEVGIDAMRSVAEATSKAVSIASAKQDPSPQPGTTEPKGKGVFQLGV